MYRLEKTFRFEAAHKLPHHDGKCQRLHGHSWVGVVILWGAYLWNEGPKQGMLMDFGDVGKVINEMVEGFLDHHYLNDTLGLENPTSEEIARWCYVFLSGKFPAGMLRSVRIHETCTCSAEYRP